MQEETVASMRAMILDAAVQPLRAAEIPRPVPGPDQVLVQVHACGVCRTDLHVFDGELPDPKPPLVLGHQIVGTIVGLGQQMDRFQAGDRVGIPGSAIPAASAATAGPVARTCATGPASPATRSTGVMDRSD